MNAKISALAVGVILLLLLPVALAEKGEVKENIAEAPTAAASDAIHVVKSAPASAAFGKDVDITIRITSDAAADVTVREALSDADPVGMDAAVTDVPKGIYAARPPELRWTRHLDAGVAQIITYTIRPHTVGMLSIGSTAVETDSGRFFSNPIRIRVTCVSDGVCDAGLGESTMSCPADCPIPQKRIEPPSLDVEETPPVSPDGAHDALIVGAIAVFIGGFIVWIVWRRKKR